MVDPGFPRRGGGANLRGGVPTYYLANFPRKLHENEEILGQTGGGGAGPGRPSHLNLDPPLVILPFIVQFYSCCFCGGSC